MADVRRPGLHAALGLVTALVMLSNADSAEPTGGREAASLKRAQDVAALMSGEQLPAAEKLFAPSFLGRLPLGGLGELLARLRARVGNCEQVVRTESIARGVESYRMLCEHGTVVEFDLGVEPGPPHRIEAWLIRNITATAPSSAPPALGALEAARQALAQLGPQAGGVLVELRRGEPVAHLRHQAERPFLIGSLAKLCTLSTLLDAVDTHQLRWGDVTHLEESDRSLPTGSLAFWPAATPLTIQTLATLLILESDNTANDMLLRLLDALPSSLRPGGACDPAPMSTRQYFGLRAAPELAAQHAAATTPAKRQQILHQLPQLDMDNLGARVQANANKAPLTGWTATPDQLAGVLRRLHVQLRRPAAAPVREIFRASSRRDPVLAAFPFVAAKGGSDHGLMSHGLIVEAGPDSSWQFVLVWNGHTSLPPQAYRDALQSLLAAIAKRALAPSGSLPGYAGPPQP